MIEWGELSIASVVGGVLGALATFSVRQYFESERGRRDLSFNLHARFNSPKVLKARTVADEIVVQFPRYELSEVPKTPSGLISIWMVAREYEFISIAIDEGNVDRRIIAQYFFEVFVYWAQHFRFIYQKQHIDLVGRLHSLDVFFRTHALTRDRYSEMETRQRDYIANAVGYPFGPAPAWSMPPIQKQRPLSDLSEKISAFLNDLRSVVM